MQDAFGTPGITLNLGSAEKTALDVIGYTLLTSLTWNPNNTFASGAPTDGSGTWTTASGATWYNGTSSSVWVNSPVQNAQFGTPGTASTTPYTVTLGSPITAGTIVFANANYTIAGGGNSLTIANGITAAVNATISANIILGGANTWQVASGATLAVSGNISERLGGPRPDQARARGSYSLRHKQLYRWNNDCRRNLVSAQLGGFARRRKCHRLWRRAGYQWTEPLHWQFDLWRWGVHFRGHAD